MGAGGIVRGSRRYRACVGAGGTVHGSGRHSAWERDKEMVRL